MKLFSFITNCYYSTYNGTVLIMYNKKIIENPSCTFVIFHEKAIQV